VQGFKLTQKALDDLRAIGRYTVKKWGIQQRNKYLTMFMESDFQKSNPLAYEIMKAGVELR